MSTEKLQSRRLLAGVIAGGAALALSAAPALAKPAHGKKPANGKSGGATLYVAPNGKGKACTLKAPCKTISAATAKAKPGGKIVVAKGTYREDVAVTKKLSILGVHKPTIDAMGKENGFTISGPKAAGSRVRGFVVEHATFEGIIAVSTERITISDNLVRENDLGAKSSEPIGECAAQGPIPGDCGEGVHLMGTSHSQVLRNRVTGNSGGILLTDEVGPADHNTVAHNKVTKNLYDCGITLAGHSTEAVSKEGKLQPTMAGVYDNKILDNVSNGNGVKGEGAGILLAAGAPGSGVYGNLVKGNTANGNGMAGVTLHSHAPGQDLNGNKIIGNSLSKDGISGNKGKPGDEDAGVSGTVGILVFSAVTKLEGTVITANTVSNVHYGIWTMNSATKVSAKANKFKKVAAPVTQL